MTVGQPYFRKKPSRRIEWMHIPFIIGVDRDAPFIRRTTPQFHGRIRGFPMVTKNIHSTGMVTLTLPANFYDVRGNPLKLDPTNPPTWTTDNPAILALEPSADGLSCNVMAVGTIGEAQVQVKIDVAPGPDVEGGMGICAFKVGPGRLAAFDLVVGTETEQPVPTPTPATDSTTATT